jgi:hypothetical protein
MSEIGVLLSSSTSLPSSPSPTVANIFGGGNNEPHSIIPSVSPTHGLDALSHLSNYYVMSRKTKKRYEIEPVELGNRRPLYVKRKKNIFFL